MMDMDDSDRWVGDEYVPHEQDWKNPNNLERLVNLLSLFQTEMTHSDFTLDKALHAVKIGLEKWPDSYSLRLEIGKIYGDFCPQPQGNIKAEEQFIEAISRSNNPEKEIFSAWPNDFVFYQLGICALNSGNYWKAAFFFLVQSFILPADHLRKNQMKYLFSLREEINDQSFSVTIDKLLERENNN